MRVTEIVDYNHVQDRHQAIHARLENWRRWVIVRPHGWQVAPDVPHVPEQVQAVARPL